ncbi:Mismatch repair endonuclease PMS2 [Echinococcus granulosus]|uniref:Mismatch repair endonuclease PMS2 n=1 Tax=Echinococcus granulosus TaxID=6210 RepID=W6USS9_ECHGR|nr:Mismatch repair endonuclease PMS2 [Echinococcus granulosus]EUB64680.1 Mismatch repair endonuclease PMS2 [Echinococcus granulosus]
MSSVRTLDAQSVHKLCSSQVVVTLGIAIKELIENSIDAEATKIEIRLKNYGSDSIEVVDDGLGIDEADFETLGKSHSTSKIQDFNDISKTSSFGFRGEAIFSLCQVADVTIHTRTERAKVGTRLEFTNSGGLKSRRPLARSRGTTVCVERLFHTLPVRRRYLTDRTRLSKEFSQAIALISSYCLMVTGVQLVCYRIDRKGTKTLVVSNMEGELVSSNIAAVYGQAQRFQLESLVEITNDFVVTDELKEEYKVKLSAEELDEIRIFGFISMPPMGSTNVVGRSSADRQFVSINGRPCDFPQFTRLATDVWRRCCRESLFSKSQSLGMPSRSTTSAFPVLVLLINLPRAKVDVNLSPDKRQLLLHWERAVVMKLKAALTATLVRVDGEQSIANLPVSSSTAAAVATASEAAVGLTQQPPISAHLPPQPESSSQNGKKPRLSTPSSSPIASQKPVFSSDSARRNYNRHLPLLNRESVRVEFSVGRLLKYWAARGSSDVLVETPSTGEFHANLTESAAQSELTSIFRKEWFRDMRVIGQFNKGFIVCQHEEDLFIVDQHASDEKHRFENLCANHQFTSQPLVVPQRLVLNAVQEHLLEENMDVFSESGFIFSTDENAPLGQRFHLISAPMSEGKVFGLADIEEMLFVLSESLSRNCRPSRLRDMLASRACRSAVMIGTVLDHKQMARIVSNMSTMEHPWNCPHGRPTMRHLFHLGRLRQLEQR